MRYAAAFLIAGCFFMAGRQVSGKLEIRIEKLEKIYVLLSDIKSRIEFTADCAADIFSSLSESHSYDALAFVKDCALRLSQGESFDSAWKTAVSKKENVSGLKKEDISLLFSFGGGFGTTDTTGQLSNCEIHKKLIEEKIAAAHKDFNMYSRPAKGIGLLAGVAVLILSV